MKADRFYYLIHFQYLGFRYHGWQRQPGVRTVQEMVEKTIRFVLEHDEFKVLAAGRTDAKVSAAHAAFELFLREQADTDWLYSSLNKNLPNDIRILKIEEVDSSFNIIQSPRIKEYLYLFSSGGKNHPFCAPLMVYMEEDLDIPAMKEAARLFEGEHDFRAFCHLPSGDRQTIRTVTTSEITRNDLYSASFFPEESWLYRVCGSGFMRHQVRLMMGALFSVGLGRLDKEVIASALRGEIQDPPAFMAPQSGLILQKLEFSRS